MNSTLFARLLLTLCCLLTFTEAQVISFTRAELPLTPETMPWQPIKTVDLNNDGMLDLIGVNLDQIVVLLGNGNGTFQPAKVTDVPGVGFAAEFETGYINRDGVLDLVAANLGTGSILICLGNGDGTFSVHTLQHSAEIESITAGDFTNNNTNALDIVVSDSLNRIALYPGNFDGTFQSPILTQLQDIATKIRPIKLQRVGVADLAFLVTGVAYVWKNVGGHFYAFRKLSPGTGNTATDVVVADVNGDIHPDLIVPYQHGDLQGGGSCGPSDPCSGLKVFYNDGAGNFTRKDVIYATTYTRISHPVVGDFNQDGVNDLAMFADRKSDDVLVLLSKGTGSFNAPLRVFNSNRSLFSNGLTSGDFNGNGKIDIVTAASPTEAQQEGAFTMLFNQTPDLVGCSRPDSPGVHICTPAAGIDKASPVRITAGGRNLFPTYSMLVWLDGTRRYEVISTRVNTSQKVSPGYHRLVVESFFFGDVRGEKAVLYFPTPCLNAASFEGINVCSPASGSSVSSPVKVQAFVKISTGPTIYRFELWVDGVKKVSVGSTGIMDTSVALGLGNHKFEFVSRQTDGSRLTKTLFATVH